MSTKQQTADLFRGKRVVVMGLGLLGGALNDAIFLAKAGAILTITDLKTAEQLKTSIDKLKKYKGIKYVLGEHRLEDFREADIILQPGNVPMDSPYLAEARKNNIPIFVSESLFAQLAQGVMIIGVTGTRGKSTTTQLIYEILALRQAQAGKKNLKIFLAGNTKGVSTLSLLGEVTAGDIVVMELDSWALHGLGNIKQSPHISVFTNFMVDHQNFYGSTALTTSNCGSTALTTSNSGSSSLTTSNSVSTALTTSNCGSTSLTTSKSGMELYFADKANIFLNQKEEDYLVTGAEVLKLIQKKYKKPARKNFSEKNFGGYSSKIIAPDIGVVPKSWKVKLLGEHNLQNIAYAVTVARILDVPEKTIKQAVEGYKGVPGRLEFIKEIKGIRFYNDTTATTPDATLVALKALRPSLKAGGGIVLISGGTDKKLDFKQYAKDVPKVVKALVLFKGTATEEILKSLKVHKVGKSIKPIIVGNMKDAIIRARKLATKNDVILLSPGSASFGIFQNEFDRGEQFNKIVKSLK